MIQSFDDLYLQLAKLAIENGDWKMFMRCLQNRKRTLKKEMATALTVTTTDKPIES